MGGGENSLARGGTGAVFEDGGQEKIMGGRAGMEF